MRTYAQNNEAWKQVNALLPEDFQMKLDNLPKEEIWEWNGNVMHVDRYANPDAKIRLFLHHGVGTNGRQLMMIFGHKMAALGYEVVAMDNLGYGMTEVNQKDVTYDNWVHAFADFVNYETKRDYKKPILYGHSAGGMITYHASCYMDEVYGIIGMCFLKNDDKTVGEETSKFKGTSWIVVPAMKIEDTFQDPTPHADDSAEGCVEDGCVDQSSPSIEDNDERPSVGRCQRAVAVFGPIHDLPDARTRLEVRQVPHSAHPARTRPLDTLETQ